VVGVLAASPLASPAGAEGTGSPPPRVLASGLSSPRGLTSFLGEVPIVGQGAFGPPGPVVAVLGDRLIEMSPPRGFVDVVVSSDFSLWGIEANTGLVYRHEAETPGLVLVADIPAYQAGDPDPDDTEGAPEESNPYGLAAIPGSPDVLLADAAGNDLLRIKPDGRISTVARFQLEAVSTDHIPDFPGPPSIDAESVPTSVVVTRHGIYVGELKGFPFRPGSSNVYRIDRGVRGVTCGPTEPDPRCEVAHEDLTAIQDMAIDPATGRTYIYQLAADGTLAFEAGFETGVFPPAVLLEIKPGGLRRELAAGQLSQPGGVTAYRGHIVVTDGIFGDGRVLEVARRR
jgi:hypothetical protein